MQKPDGRTDSAAALRLRELLQCGAEIPDDSVRDVAVERRQLHDRLRCLSEASAFDELAVKAECLERCLGELEEGIGASRKPDFGRAAASAALALGAETRWLLALVDALSPRISHDPLAFVDDELDWIERSTRELSRSHPRLVAEANGAAARAARTRQRMPLLKAERFLARTDRSPVLPPLDQAFGVWSKLEESFDIETQLRREHGGAGHASAELDRVQTRRSLIADELREKLACLAPGEMGSFVRAASAELLDQSSLVLSEGSVAAPARRLPELRVLRERIRLFLDIAKSARRKTESVATHGSEAQPGVRKSLDSLERARKRARAAEREATARLRLEERFGSRRLARFEGWLLVLLFAFVVLVVVEWKLPESSPWLPLVHAADIALCVVFQIDFFLRWASSGWSVVYFLRHFFVESLPALPYGFLLSHVESIPSIAGLEELRALIILRALSLQNALLLILRGARILVFFVRGTDRAVEKLRGFLDCNIVIFDSNPLGDVREPALERRLLSLEGRRRKVARGLFEVLHADDRPAILARHGASLEVEARLHADVGLPYLRGARDQATDVHIERVIHGLLDCDASKALSALGHEGVRRVARWLRFLDVPVIRHGPVVRRIVPAARNPSAPEAVAEAAHSSGQMLQGLLGVLRFWGDLAGITTGPQILDRLGTAVVAATSRPAVRLLLFSIVILSFKGFAFFVPALGHAATSLWRGMGAPVLVLGTVCLVLMFAGRWVKRVAGEALDLYLRTADAHFYPLLKTWKRGRRDQDLGTLLRAVFLPEAKLRSGSAAQLEKWRETLLGALKSGFTARETGADDPWSARLRDDASLVALLYRDFLDGPLLHRADDKTSVQLLGNLSVQDVRFQVLGMTRKQIRALERLDLEKYRLLGLGPYFWFRFITESLAIETAKLVMEYNTSCIALEELPFASPAKRKRFEAFLEARKAPWEVAVERCAGKSIQCLAEPMTTDDFTALHFLTSDVELEETIGARFGESVLAALRRDRRGMVRDIFGTRPYHLLSREGRSFNPYRLYQRYLGGALFLLLPLVVVYGALRIVSAGLRDVLRLMLDILGAQSAQASQPSRAAGFDVAVRKINRMRKPFFMEALWLRAAVDVEYLGLRLPGFDLDPEAPSFEEDLDFIDALESERHPIVALRDAALRDLRTLREYLDEQGWIADGMEDLLLSLDPSGKLMERKGEAIRALVTAFITDQSSIRTILTSEAAARNLVRRLAGRDPKLIRRVWLELVAVGSLVIPAWRRRRRLFEKYTIAARHPKDLPAAVRRRIGLDLALLGPECETTLRHAVNCLSADEATKGAVANEIREAIRGHAVWTRRILMMRALQAITVLDIQCYRDFVFEAGGYADEP